MLFNIAVSNSPIIDNIANQKIGPRARNKTNSDKNIKNTVNSVFIRIMSLMSEVEQFSKSNNFSVEATEFTSAIALPNGSNNGIKEPPSCSFNASKNPRM
jgi:hypothetical protein